MGFFTSLFGWDQNLGAVNAVLASHLFDKVNDDLKRKITREVFDINRAVCQGANPAELLDRISNSDRVAQMNFVALACDNLLIPPPVKNNVWSRIKNPYWISNLIDDNRIDAAIYSISRQDGITISWPGRNTKIDFKRIMDSNLSKTEQPANKASKLSLIPFDPLIPDITQQDSKAIFRCQEYTAFFTSNVAPLSAKHGIKSNTEYIHVFVIFNDQRHPVFFINYEYNSLMNTYALCTIESDGGRNNLGRNDDLLNDDNFITVALDLMKHKYGLCFT